MRTLLCSVPDGALDAYHACTPLIPRGANTRHPPFPLGIVRVLWEMEQNGYDGDIYDINNLRHKDEVIIDNFKKYKPDIIGLSGTLSHCYPHMKRIANLIRNLFPKVWIIVGGNISASANILLNKTDTDVCVVGDGEIPFIKILNYIKLNPDRKNINYTELDRIRGLAYLDKNQKFKLTGFAEQIPSEQMQYPNYDKLEWGLQEFGGSSELIYEIFDNAESLRDVTALSVQKHHLTKELLEIHDKIKNTKVARIQTSKGCVAKCTFCQRAIRGYRVFGPNQLETRIIELKKKYNIGCLIINDENFGSDRKQGYECAKVMKKHDVYWTAEGARAKSISVEDLEFYKKHNLLAIRYGIESGSQKILDIMEKKTTKEKVFEQISTCKRLGIATASEVFMLGTPGESRETVLETAEFAAKLRYLLEEDWNTAYPCWATAIPGTPLYEYSQQIGVIGRTIDEEEEYLIRTADEVEEHGILNYLNKTDYEIKEVHYWIYLYRYAGRKAYVDEIIKNNKSIKNILSEVYNKCIKESFESFKNDYKRKNVKNLKFPKKIKTFSNILIKLIISLSIPILPKLILYPLLKMMSDVNFNILKKNHKSKTGRQRYNFFLDSETKKKPLRNFVFTQDKIDKTTKTIERSLRTVVKANSQQMKLPITDEEKSYQILARQQ